MKKKKATGQVRMKQLGRVKIELWLSAANANELLKLCAVLGVRRATMAKRMINYMVAGGSNYARAANLDRYD